jgi:hypothetical protein
MKQLLILCVLLISFSCIQNKNEKKQPNIIATKSIRSACFDLQYPFDWVIDSTDKDYDLDV